nr:MAG TPA: hypothetical protein [Caudoviricetes sp.]
MNLLAAQMGRDTEKFLRKSANGLYKPSYADYN